MLKQKWILMAIISLVLVGCATTQGDWQKAHMRNTMQSYQEFLSKHPESEFTVEANRQIQNLEWQKTKELDTIQSYELFLSKYPKTKYAAEAKTSLEKKEWEKASRMGTIESYEKFLDKYPASMFRKEAKSRIEEMNFELAKTTNTLSSYNDFLRRYPQSKFVDDARRKLESIHKSIREQVPDIGVPITNGDLRITVTSVNTSETFHGHKITNPDFIFVVVTYKIGELTERQRKEMSISQLYHILLDSSGKELRLPSIMHFPTNTFATAFPRIIISDLKLVFKGVGPDFPPIPIGSALSRRSYQSQK